MKTVRVTSLMLILLLMALPCSAERYNGKTVAKETTDILMPQDGRIDELSVETGCAVKADQPLFSIKEQAVFASQDGTVADLTAREGGTISEKVLTLRPTEQYKVYCTVSEDTGDAFENRIVHCGETLYLSCTKNGTHRAVGIVSQITGNEYFVLTLGGKLYLGETVDLYRSDAFEADDRVGIGTVVMNDTEDYGGEGIVRKLYVEAGDFVERGQILYTYTSGKKSVVSAPTDGILTKLAVRKGEEVSKDTPVATFVAYDRIAVELQTDEYEINRFDIGDTVLLYYADEENSAVEGKVISMSAGNDGQKDYIITIQPEVPCERIGMDVIVETSEG